MSKPWQGVPAPTGASVTYTWGIYFWRVEAKPLVEVIDGWVWINGVRSDRRVPA